MRFVLGMVVGIGLMFVFCNHAYGWINRALYETARLIGGF